LQIKYVTINRADVTRVLSHLTLAEAICHWFSRAPNFWPGYRMSRDIGVNFMLIYIKWHASFFREGVEW